MCAYFAVYCVLGGQQVFRAKFREQTGTNLRPVVLGGKSRAALGLLRAGVDNSTQTGRDLGAPNHISKE